MHRRADASGHMPDVPAPAAAETTPLLILIASSEGKGASWAAEVMAAGARAMHIADCGALPRLLESGSIDAVVVCADETGKCRERLGVARRMINLVARAVPLIAWRADPHGPCGARSVMYQAGADSVLDAPSPVHDLLSCVFALRRLIRTVHEEG